MVTWQMIGLLYVAGVGGTLRYNLRGMIFMTRPLVVLRNAVFWPFFLPVLIAFKDDRK